MFYDFNTLNIAPAIQTPAAWPGTVALLNAKGNCQAPMKLPVLKRVNQLVVGAPGTGKTVYTKAYVRELLDNRKAVFFEVKPRDYTGAFLRIQDKVLTYNGTPFPANNLFKWNMVKEIRDRGPGNWDEELKEISTMLFGEYLEDPHARTWAEPAREVFAAFLKVILYQYGNCPPNRQVIGALRNYDDVKLFKFLAEYPPNRSLLRRYFAFDDAHPENYCQTRKGSDILFFLQQALEPFGGTYLSDDGTDTLHDYLNGQYGERLFLVYDFGKQEASKIFLSYFLKKLIRERMSLSASHPEDCLLVLDEVDKLGHDIGIYEAVNLGREFGLQTILSTQSAESLYCLSPSTNAEHITRATLSGFPIITSFRPGDIETIETVTGLFGKKKQETIVLPASRLDKPVVHFAEEAIVPGEKLLSLGVGEFYTKITNTQPMQMKLIL